MGLFGPANRSNKSDETILNGSVGNKQRGRIQGRPSANDDEYPKFGQGGSGAPIRDEKSGKVITGVGGRFQRDFYKNDSPPVNDTEKKRENLENVKQEIESKRQQRMSESHDQPASEDLVDKIRQLDSIGKAAGNKRSKLRTTSDVTRMKMDIRYPSEKEAKDYFSHLQGQEQTKREIQSKEQARSLEPPESAKAFETTVEMLEKKRLLFEEMRKNRNDNKTSFDDGTRLRSNSNPKVEESTTSKYRKETNKLQKPFATED